MSMIYPTVLLLTIGKEVHYTTIMAITNAVYATYKIIASILSIKKARKDKDSFFKQKLSLINMEGSFVTLILLENTMLHVFSKDFNSIVSLQNITTILIVALMILLALISLIKTIYEIYNDRLKKIT